MWTVSKKIYEIFKCKSVFQNISNQMEIEYLLYKRLQEMFN